MYTDIIDLRDFYETSLGQVAARLLRSRIRRIWPSVEGLSVLGLGYAAPYLRPFLGEADRLLAFMAAQQGVLPWPNNAPNVVSLVDDADLPLQASSVDRVLLVHALECTDQAQLLLAEAWRVLASGGRLLAVVPNRRGIWAQLDRTPFGTGQPYTAGQLSRLLRDAAFTPVTATGSLYVPPTTYRMVLAGAAAWEGVGARWFGSFAGVVLIEATKQVYARKPASTIRHRRLAYRPAEATI